VQRIAVLTFVCGNAGGSGGGTSEWRPRGPFPHGPTRPKRGGDPASGQLARRPQRQRFSPHGRLRSHGVHSARDGGAHWRALAGRRTPHPVHAHFPSLPPPRVQLYKYLAQGFCVSSRELRPGLTATLICSPGRALTADSPGAKTDSATTTSRTSSTRRYHRHRSRVHTRPRGCRRSPQVAKGLLEVLGKVAHTTRTLSHATAPLSDPTGPCSPRPEGRGTSARG
jgi:hypothetical protein